MSNLVRFFGTSAASPSLKRGFACIGLVEKNQNGTKDDDIVLLDCGDGSIRKIMEAKTSCLSISDILVTHFHSDHLSGLAQVIESMDIQKRTRELNVFGPKGLKEYFNQVEETTRIASKRKFIINIKELDAGTRNTKLSNYKLSTFEMEHTVPCLGYRVECPDFILAYTGDTQPCNELQNLAHGADLLIHEATFLQKDIDRARSAKHSTPREAAEDAERSDVRGLVITHINDNYETEEEVISESEIIYPKVRVARDGLEIPL
jgi:ribonuclease Z